MEITVNLANEPYIDSRPILRGLRISMAITAVLTIAVVATAFLVHRRARETRGRNHAIEASLDSLQAEQRAYRSMMRATDVVEVAHQADELNQIFDAKAFSWTAVMQGLERVLPGKVQVTAIEPIRTKDGSTSLHLRVVGPHEKSVDLLRNLEGSRRFLQPRIVGESLANNQGAGQKSVAIDASTMMEFDLMTDYNGSVQDVPAQQGNVPSKESPNKRAQVPITARKVSSVISRRGSGVGGAH
jgi:type IV pilus assembly protein PilN